MMLLVGDMLFEVMLWLAGAVTLVLAVTAGQDQPIPRPL